MAAFAPSRILVIGATGAIGRFITDAIVSASPPFKHVAIFTSPNTAESKSELLQKWKQTGVSVLVGDITKDANVAAIYASEKPDTVISCLGRGALEAQTKLIQLADESGSVKWLFPSEYGTDIEHNPKSAAEKTHQVKLAVRKFIREQVKNLKVTYLVTGPYFDMWVNAQSKEAKAGGFDVAKREASIIGDGEGKIGFCTMPDVGKFLVASLRHPADSFGKALKVQSFIVTPNEVLAEYERQTGGKWNVSSTSLQDLKDFESKLWGEGNPVATGATLRRIWAEGGTLYEKNDNELLGLHVGDLDSLETAVRAALLKAKA